MNTTLVPRPFGTVVADRMTSARSLNGTFDDWHVHPVDTLSLHPAAHALHYGSACFEALKAHRGADGIVRIFRLADHVQRMRSSAAGVCLPVPETLLLTQMIREAVTANLDQTPPSPGALYLRPTLLGTDPNVGAATAPSTEALLYVLACPVGDYFDSAEALTVAIETALPRTTPQFGRIKAGANYAMALGVTQRARTAHGANQVLFAPGGLVQEAGAGNFLLLDDTRVVTKGLDDSFLHGITRDSILTIAAHLGYRVEERDLSVDEVVRSAEHGEAALVGTAAGMAGIGTLIHQGQRVKVGTGDVGRNTRRLREALQAVQRAEAADLWGWTEAVRDCATPRRAGGR